LNTGAHHKPQIASQQPRITLLILLCLPKTSHKRPIKTQPTRTGVKMERLSFSRSPHSSN
jgi:hypothetical protein